MSETRKKGGALDTLLLIGGLGVLTGSALLAGAVALTWQPRHTDSLISTTAAICGGGFVMFALVIGLFVGIAFYRRLDDRRDAMPPPMVYPPAMTGGGWQESLPPALPNPDKAGTWAGGGAQTYDLWEEDASAHTFAREWSEVDA